MCAPGKVMERSKKVKYCTRLERRKGEKDERRKPQTRQKREQEDREEQINQLHEARRKGCKSKLKRQPGLKENSKSREKRVFIMLQREGFPGSFATGTPRTSSDCFFKGESISLTEGLVTLLKRRGGIPMPMGDGGRRSFQRSVSMIHWPCALGCDGGPVVDVCVPGSMNPGGNIGMPGNEKPNPGTAGGTPIALALGPEAESRSRSRSWSPLPLPLPLLWLSSPPLPPPPPPPPPPLRSLRRKRSWLYRLDWGPRLPPWSVAMRRLMAVLVVSVSLHAKHKVESSRPFRFLYVPLEDTPAPISISGSSTTIPFSMGLPPVPPYSAVRSHLRSASVNRSTGIMLTPV